MNGISFIVDKRGRKTAVVIDLRQHEQLWKDFYDALLAQSRIHESRESLPSVRQRLNQKSSKNPEFARTMKIAASISRRYRNALKELAK